MKLNRNQIILLEQLNSSFYLGLFSIFKLPLMFITGLKIEEIDYSTCKTKVNYNYLNKNPFKSTYFAVQSMAAELSTGTLALLAVEGLKSDVKFILIGLSGDFLKKSKDKTFFICSEGEKLHETVKKARATRKQQEVTVSTIGYNKSDEIVSKFEFTWSFKLKNN
tara:strand:+ start:262 stop:756 length:495 start_codon:yes stop_codon:yes gene_type:complete